MSETQNEPTPAPQIIPDLIPADAIPRKYTSVNQAKEMQRNDQTRNAVRSLQLYILLLQERISRLEIKLSAKEKPAKNA